MDIVWFDLGCRFLTGVGFAVLAFIAACNIRKLTKRVIELTKVVELHNEAYKSLNKLVTSMADYDKKFNDELIECIGSMGESFLEVSKDTRHIAIWVDVQKLASIKASIICLFKDEKYEEINEVAKRYDEYREFLREQYKIDIPETAQDILKSLNP